MTRADDTTLINLFEEFYQSYYQEDIEEFNDDIHQP